MSLVQAVQSHITGTRNHTALGLAVKSHHKYGRSELIHILYDHGFTTPYDEQIRLRKSAAKFVSSEGNVLQEAMGLSRRVGPIFGWFDNFDLSVSTPNGRRETHVMAHEFQTNATGIIEKGEVEPGLMNLKIPRLPRSSCDTINNMPAIPLQHYTGPRKMNPPSACHNIWNSLCGCVF